MGAQPPWKEVCGAQSSQGDCLEEGLQPVMEDAGIWRGKRLHLQPVVDALRAALFLSCLCSFFS